MRIYKIAVDDLLIDYKAVSEELQRFFLGTSPQKIFGMVEQQNQVWLLMEESSSSEAESCFFLPLKEFGAAALEEEIMSHYQGDQLLLGRIKLNEDESLLLYKKQRGMK